MLSSAMLFLVLAIVAAVPGFAEIAGTAATIAEVLVLVFLILFPISFVRGRTTAVG